MQPEPEPSPVDAARRADSRPEGPEEAGVHLRLDAVHKRFGAVTALGGLSFEVRRGEFFCLLGASAAGKTTALRVIAGLEEPDAGRVTFDGEDLAGVAVQDRGMAMVFQTFALYPHLTVYENIAYPLREARVPAAEVRSRVHAMAEMLAIGHILERRPGTASGGEQQRVAIGRALVRRPRLLLLDEPLTNLDAKLRHDMRAEFKRLHRELGTTMLYATPDELEALGMGERIGVLRDGRIVQTGSPDELYERPSDAYVGQMVGSPRMNLAPAERAASGAAVATSFGELAGGPWTEALAPLAPGAGLLLGFRPSDLRPVGGGGTGLGGTEGAGGARNGGEAAPERRGPYLRFPAGVHLTEPLGDLTVIDLDVGEHLFRMVLPESEAVRYRTGDRLEVELAVERTHLFRRDTGAALAPGRRAGTAR